MVMTVGLNENSYDITVGKGILKDAASIFGIRGKSIVVTDDGVPTEYAQTVSAALGGAKIYTMPHGEKTKCMAEYEKLLSFMLECSLTRSDCVVAVGGGVVGDLACFAASTYMRGIKFYNIPTTLLSQVDSSIGGKCGIDFGSYKNIVGTFCQPRGVLIDTDLLSTLDSRNMACGYAEALKMGMTSDPELFGIFERGEQESLLSDVIVRSIKVKKAVVEEDEKEKGLRRILNFGHTVGHAIESMEELKGMLHGECVALGMIPMTGRSIRGKLVKILASLGLPTEYDFASPDIISALSHDKKGNASGVDAVFVNEIGKFEIRTVTLDEIADLLKDAAEDKL